MAAATDFSLFLLLPSLLLHGAAGQQPQKGPNVFRAAAAALEELLPEGAAETFRHYWKVAINGASAIGSLLTESCFELLDVLGIKGGELGLDHEALGKALSWALAALLIYLTLTVALRLLAFLVGRLLWLVKLGLFLTAGAYVVATSEDEKRRNALLLGLGVLYLALGRLRLPLAGDCNGAEQCGHQLENKINSLERQLAEVEHKVHRKKLYEYN